ncbi:hypothetical protein FB567DRAFT_540229 [Paraphoma chrysanthemicola]|uniref:Uncharacterized protein n=1 Tax=Paraphoma chrysanthemicola TaxID=798071 RepID=A0A8K0QTI8_9PLEO|nr:hypothetical protein FB567DRAFT_540229 [Paraphoma chrysanthemicola]
MYIGGDRHTSYFPDANHRLAPGLPQFQDKRYPSDINQTGDANAVGPVALAVRRSRKENASAPTHPEEAPDDTQETEIGAVRRKIRNATKLVSAPHTGRSRRANSLEVPNSEEEWTSINASQTSKPVEPGLVRRRNNPRPSRSRPTGRQYDQGHHMLDEYLAPDSSPLPLPVASDDTKMHMSRKTTVNLPLLMHIRRSSGIVAMNSGSSFRSSPMNRKYSALNLWCLLFALFTLN